MSPLRLLYRALLHLYPSPFRDRFSEEMLWIFDEQTREGRSFHLLVDILRSLAIQHIDAHLDVQPQPDGFYSEIHSGLSLRRLAHTALVYVAAVSGVFYLVGPQSPVSKLLSPSLVFSGVHNTQTGWYLIRIDLDSMDIRHQGDQPESVLEDTSTPPGDSK